MLIALLGQIPEAIYFALFMIFTKNLKEKRLLFILLMIAEELLLINIFPNSIWFNVLYTALMYVILKVLYKEKAQIIDIFTFMISSLILLAINTISYLSIYMITNNFILYVIIDRILLALFLLITHKKLNKIQNLYKKFWNRDDKVPKRMKTTTFRCINIIIFNIMFYLANIVLVMINYIK